MGKCIMCQHCGSWFFPEEGVSLDDCPKCGRTVGAPPAPAPTMSAKMSSAGATAATESSETEAENVRKDVQPAHLGLNRRQRRCIRNAEWRFRAMGFDMADELLMCFPEAFKPRGKGRM